MPVFDNILENASDTLVQSLNAVLPAPQFQRPASRYVK